MDASPLPGPLPGPRSRLSPAEVRLITLRAQGLVGARPGGGVPGMVRRLGAVQLDTISVLARSHELVAYARLGGDRPQSSGAGLLGTEERNVRVLVPRRLRTSARGLAGLRVHAPRPTREGQ